MSLLCFSLYFKYYCWSIKTYKRRLLCGWCIVPVQPNPVTWGSADKKQLLSVLVVWGTTLAVCRASGGAQRLKVKRCWIFFKHTSLPGTYSNPMNELKQRAAAEPVVCATATRLIWHPWLPPRLFSPPLNAVTTSQRGAAGEMPPRPHPMLNMPETHWSSIKSPANPLVI